MLEEFERSIFVKNRNIQLACLGDNFACVVCLVDVYCNSVRAVAYLSYSVADEAVVLDAVIGSNNVESLANLEES